MLESVSTYAELLIMKRDAEILKKLFATHDSTITIGLIPFASLFVYEALEYLRKSGNPVEFETSSIYSIDSIRNKVKFFDLSINQLLNTIRNVDRLQHEEFVGRMRYPNLRNWNVHDNLGICYDSNGHIILNTQYAYYLFQDSKSMKGNVNNIPQTLMTNPQLDPNEIQAYGIDLGRIIGGISKGLSSLSDFVSCDVYIGGLSFLDKDVNTNRIWLGNEEYKLFKLFLLHMLCCINFTLYCLKIAIIRDNGWLLRIEYIIYHYALRRLTEMKRHIQANIINDPLLIKMMQKLNLTDKDNINSNMRNCMMHYKLILASGETILNEDHCDLDLPLCGIIESIFKGKSYWAYQQGIEKRLMDLSTSLSEYFSIT